MMKRFNKILTLILELILERSKKISGQVTPSSKQSKKDFNLLSITYIWNEISEISSKNLKIFDLPTRKFQKSKIFKFHSNYIDLFF